MAGSPEARQSLPVKENKGLVDKGLDAGEKVSKVTLVGWTGVTAGALILGAPGVAAVGAIGAGVDVVQIVGIKEIRKRRPKARSARNGVFLQQIRQDRVAANDDNFDGNKSNEVVIYQGEGLRRAA